MNKEPTLFNFVTDVLMPLATRRGRDTALISFDEGGDERRFSFGEVAQMAQRTGNALALAGAGRGDMVMTLTGSTPEWVASMLGAWRIGAVALPCNEMLRAKDLAHRVALAKPAVIVTSDRNLDELERAIDLCGREPRVIVAESGELSAATSPEAGPCQTAIDDPALVIFTSGTAGEPRPVVHSQRYLWGQQVQARHWVAAHEGDVAWCTAATGWSKSSRNVFVAPWLCGATAVVEDARFDPQRRLETVRRACVTVLCQAPTEYRMIAKRVQLDKAATGGLRHLISAGEPLNPEIVGTFKDSTGLEIHDSYGQTETGALTAMPPDGPVRPGSMGKALPGFGLHLKDGELHVKVATVPTIFKGYLDGEPLSSEWYATGDLVREDDDGYLWFEGRSDDLILSAGYRIGPFEVESALVEHPCVVEAAAVAAPDEERGSIVKAYVVLKDGDGTGGLAQELQDHVKRVTAPYKYPRQIEFVEELPKTASGKIKRAELRNS